MSTVIVTGSRGWMNREAVERILTNACPSLVVQGGARGADRIAKEWAKANDVECRQFDANWNQYGKRAGMMRNVRMLEAYPEATVLAFPLAGPGTRGCSREARLRGMRVFVYGPDGELPLP